MAVRINAKSCLGAPSSTLCRSLQRLPKVRSPSALPAAPRVAAATTRQFYSRGYSTSSSAIGKALNSKVSFRLANVLYAGIIGTLVLYAFRRRRNKRKGKRNGGDALEAKDRVCRFENKVVVITGGGGDIGMATALAFARERASLFIVDLPHMEDTLREKCKELEREGAISAQYMTCDMSREEDVQRMVKSISDKAGCIDVLFNNAGIQGTFNPVNRQDDAEFKRVIDINIYGVFLGMKYVSRSMIASGNHGGVIVNTASMAGVVGPSDMAAYVASKFAVVGMTKTAAKDLARHGIRVCAIAPGILEGKMWDSQVRGRVKCRKEIEGDNGEVSEDEFKEQAARAMAGTPLRRLGKLSEVGSVVTFLCSEDASYLTGVTLPIDGGRIP